MCVLRVLRVLVSVLFPSTVARYEKFKENDVIENSSLMQSLQDYFDHRLDEEGHSKKVHAKLAKNDQKWLKLIAKHTVDHPDSPDTAAAEAAKALGRSFLSSSTSSAMDAVPEDGVATAANQKLSRSGTTGSLASARGSTNVGRLIAAAKVARKLHGRTKEVHDKLTATAVQHVDDPPRSSHQHKYRLADLLFRSMHERNAAKAFADVLERNRPRESAGSLRRRRLTSESKSESAGEEMFV